MATVALIPSVLGLRPGFYTLADTLRERGHDVRIVDPFDGGARDAYEDGMALADEIGQAELSRRVVERSRDLPDGFVAMGLSLGAAAAQFLATQRRVIGAVLVAGASPMAGWAAPWPTGVPAQVHAMTDDEFCTSEEIEGAVHDIEAGGGSAEVFTYPGSGHLFMDQGLADEYDAAATELFVRRVLAFLDELD